jgi:hypothetical protein
MGWRKQAREKRDDREERGEESKNSEAPRAATTGRPAWFCGRRTNGLALV